MKGGGGMADLLELPSLLAILPFRNRVLLPGAILRIRVKLVEQELWQNEGKGFIGVIPVRDSEAALVGSMLSPGMGTDSDEWSLKAPVDLVGDAQKQEAKNQQEFIHWHNRGVAARALHLSREETPRGRVTYIVVLKGLCEFSVQELSSRGTYHVACISRLDRTATELELAEQCPEIVYLSRQFKATAMELISVLEKKQKKALQAIPVHRLANIFVSCFEKNFEEQLSFLDSVDLKVRLSKATELVDRLLQSIRVAEKITQKGEGQSSESQKEFLLHPQMRAIKEELEDILVQTRAHRSQDIPPPLLDIMKVIELAGITPEEKLRIENIQSIPRELEHHGLTADQLNIPEPPSFDDREIAERMAKPGVSVGLVCTSFGVELQFIEATTRAGQGDLRLTGQVDVRTDESANIALSWVRAKAVGFKPPTDDQKDLLEGRDIHIHLPGGALQEDGSSATVTFVTSLVSLLSQRKVRADTAMTGEMSLMGFVLPVGWIKEKVLAAHRYGFKRVILPESSSFYLGDVPLDILDEMEILLAKRVDDVLEQAFKGGFPSDMTTSPAREWKMFSKL